MLDCKLDLNALIDELSAAKGNRYSFAYITREEDFLGAHQWGPWRWGARSGPRISVANRTLSVVVNLAMNGQSFAWHE
jgi:hypothetical protein